MVRLCLLALSAVAACTGEIQSENLVGLPIKEQIAQQAWQEKAMPVLGVKCVMCHDGSMPMIGYLAGADDLMRRDTLISYVPRVVNLTAPGSSRMLTKGSHTGPALDITEVMDILTWIRAEAKARESMLPPAIRTDPVTAQICTNPAVPAECPLNSVDLTPLGAAGTFEFKVQQVGPDAYFTDLKVKAGAEGIYLEHPLFESNPAGSTMPIPDPVDRFFATTLNIMANAEAPLSGTAQSFAGFNASEPLSFRFSIVEKYRLGM